MQKKSVIVLTFGFIFGIGLASCATSEPARSVATEKSSRFASGKADDKALDRECYTGEERDARGECVRVQDIQRPARRGGR